MSDEIRNNDAKRKQIVEAMVDVEYYPDLDEKEIDDKQWKAFPIAVLESLGVAFSTLPETCRTFTQTVDTGMAGGEGLYMVKFPEGVYGQLAKKKGEDAFIGSIMNNGIAGQARLVKAPITASTIVPYNPTMLFMAMALKHINKELSDIKKQQAEILEFLEEKEITQLQADLRRLTEIQSEYKYNWNNETFIRVNLNQTKNIGGNAKGKIALYRKQVVNHIPKKMLLHTNQHLSRQARELEKRFGNYRLALYVYAFSRYLSVMLLGNFDREYLDRVREEMKKYIDEYQELYTRCYHKLADIAETAVEKQLSNKMAKGHRDLGQAIADNEVLGKGPVDEALLGIGSQIDKIGSRGIDKVLQEFKTYEKTSAEPFLSCVAEVDRLNNKPAAIMISGGNLYIEQA
jgi:hypothetical protein